MTFAPSNGSGARSGLFKAAWRYARDDRPRLFLAHVVAALVGTVKISFPILVGVSINGMQVGGVAQIDSVLPYVVVIGMLLVFLWAVRVPLKMLQFGIARRAQNRMISDLNRALFAAPLIWHENRHSGDTASRQQQASGAVYQLLLDHYSGVELVIQIIGPVIALSLLSPTVLLGALAGYAIVASISVWGDHIQLQFWTREADAHRAFGTAMVDAYRNILSVYATRRRDVITTILGSKLHDVFAISRRNVLFSESKGAAIEAISTSFNLGLAVLYIYLHARNGGAGQIAIGNVYMVQVYVMTGMTSTLGLVGVISTTMRHKADFMTAHPIYAIVPDPTCAESLPTHWTVAALRGLELRYPGGDEDCSALRSVDLTLRRGCHYALVGANGSGKSTLLKILGGLIRPDSGALMVDGVTAEFAVLRNSATLVPQHPELLEGTIGHNLLVEGTTEVIASRVAECEVVRSLLDQLDVTLDSRVQEDGVNWSGGQRQRIALARGILSAAQSSLVLIDEPTSSIDPADERNIVRGLRRKFDAACLLVSIHNLELVHEFDAVIVLDRGAVKDAGRPSLVYERCDYFADKPSSF
jgi:ABC-type multidrug transport system fused ATPase/permease subunit